MLKEGTYYTDTVQIGPEHSGLTIQNEDGANVTVSGGVPLSIGAADWKPDPLMKGSCGQRSFAPACVCAHSWAQQGGCNPKRFEWNRRVVHGALVGCVGLGPGGQPQSGPRIRHTCRETR